MPPKKKGSSPRPQAEGEMKFRAACQDAYAAIRRQPAGAEKKVRKLFAHHGQGLAVIHHIQGTLYSAMADHTLDSGKKLRRLEDAADSAGRAVALAPDSAEFALSRAYALLDVARAKGDSKLYDTIIEECTRGSSVPNPRDPLRDNLRLDANDRSHLTPEQRINNMMEDLELLKSKCTTLKIFQESTTKLEGANLSEKFDQAIPQQYSSLGTSLEMMISFFEAMIAEVDGKSTGTDEMKLQTMRNAWTGMSDEAKRSFMEVRKDELGHLLEFLKLESDRETLKDILTFIVENRLWTLWNCGLCTESFNDYRGCEGHLREKHDKILDPELPVGELDRNFAEKLIRHSEWKPCDINAASLIFISDPDFKMDDEDMSWPRSWPFIQNRRSEEYCKKETLLNKIHSSFQTLLTHRCLSCNHIMFVQKYATERLNETQLRPWIGPSKLHHSLQSLCLLEHAELQYLECYLGSLLVAMDPPLHLEMETGDLCIKERVAFSSDYGTPRLVLQRSESDPDVSEKLPPDDAFISWLLEEPFVEKLRLQKSACEHKKHKLLEVVKSLDAEFHHLESIMLQRSVVRACANALLSVVGMCNKENARRRQIMNFPSQSYALHRNAKAMAIVISDILEKSPLLNLHILDDLTLDDAISSINNYKDRLETLRDERNLAVVFRELYDFVPRLINKLVACAHRNFGQMEVKTLQSLERVLQLQQYLMLLSATDYRAIVVPMMKKILWLKLENLVG